MSGLQGRETGTRAENLVGRILRKGEYQIQAILGHGGMGQVFLASHRAINVPLALKQGRADQPLPESVIAELDQILCGHPTTAYTHLDQTSEYDFPLSGGVHTDRFLREALLLARLQHPAIPALYDYFFEDGYWYLVMDYIPGRTLATHIRRHAPLAPLEAIDYAMQLCDVFDYLHRQSPPVVFRDLKPSNVIVTPIGRLMLVDFGIARYFKAGQVNDTTDFGSPGYASPEQYQGIEQTDGRSDLFSLGVLLHEMISGKRPVDIGGEARKLEPLIQDNPNISSALSGLVNVATRSEPIYRFQSAHAFYLALERAKRIEERRAFQQSIRKSWVGGRAPVTPATSDTPSGRAETAQDEIDRVPLLPTKDEEEVFHAPSTDLHLKQRRLTQEVLQKARRERLERERLEIHLASADESLKMRSYMALTPVPLDDEDERRGFSSKPLRLPLRTRHIIQISFIIALLLVLVLASLLAYGRLYRRSNTSATLPGLVTATAPSATSIAITPDNNSSSTWQSLPSLPSPEADNTAIYVQVQGQAYIYMTGGYRGPKGTSIYDHGLYRYSIASARWDKLDIKGFPGMINNAVALDEHNRLFYTGGYSPDTQSVSSLLYMYQPTNGTLQKIQPPSQIQLGFGSSIIADQHGHLYLTEGFLKAGNIHSVAGTGWYRYDIASGLWHSLAPLPAGLGYVILAPDQNGGISMIGGSSDAGKRTSTTQIFRYDISQDSWAFEQTTAPLALSAAASCLNSSGQLIIVGGYDAIHDKTYNQAWQVNLQTLSWTSLSPLPSGGSVLGAGACDGQGHFFLVRGANDSNIPTPDFWQLTIM